MRNPDKQVWLERIVRALEELKEGVQLQTVDQRTFSSRDGEEPTSSAQRDK
jgi:hypothetical protein